MKLTGKLLQLVLEFSVGVHRCSTLDVLQLWIPAEVSRLIPCERVSLNCIPSSPSALIAPPPRPYRWPADREVYRSRCLDYTLWEPLRAVAVLDGNEQGSENRDILYNEYCRPLGVTYQVSSWLGVVDSVGIELTLNRSERPFAPSEVAALQIALPHMKLAIQNAALAEALQRAVNARFEDPSCSAAGLLWVRSDAGAIERMIEPAAGLLSSAFSVRCASGDGLPEPLRAWLKSELNRLGCRERSTEPSRPYEFRSESGAFRARALSHVGGLALVLVQQMDAYGERQARTVLTAREHEVLQWIGEGKRNGEIAAILGVSPRTVGKHVENLLQKLKVETRTAAACLLAEGAR
jgi:DNA-binding CsgD family transcriptional regulator